MSMNENHQELNIFETGRTQPPKNRHGLIAVVLVAVIFLGGLFRGSYLLNIPLLRLDLSPEQNALPVRFAPSPKLEAAEIPTPSAPVCADVTVDLSSAPDSDASFCNVLESVVTVCCRTDTGFTQAAGIILSENGYILTPCHILEGALSVALQLPDGRTMSAAVVGMDRMSDLAVVYAPCSQLTPADFGDSSQLQLGDTVMVMCDGETSYQQGAVSSLHPDILTTAELPSPGSPLLNDRGQIIGIRTDPTDSRRAVPSALVKEIADQLAQNGFVAGRPDPGFSCVELTALDQKLYDLPQGVYISVVYGDSRLMPGDILQGFDGVTIRDPEAFYRHLYTRSVGDTVELSLIRNGRPKTLRLTLGEAT